MLKYALLALLSQQPRHGYELKALFEKTMGGLWPAVNIGQVYTTLARLERDGRVKGRHISQDDRPDKRVYELTAEGRAAFREWLAQPSENARIKDEFFLKLAFAQLARPEDLKDLIARQRREYLQAMRALSDLAANHTADDEIVSLLIEGAMLHLQADLKWLDVCEERISKKRET